MTMLYKVFLHKPTDDCSLMVKVLYLNTDLIMFYLAWASEGDITTR